MDFFDTAFDHAHKIETDKYTNHPHDKGGPTKHGITLATLRRVLGPEADFDHDGDVDADDVRLLSREAAKQVYRRDYWLKPGLDKIPDLAAAVKTFDLCVHAGPTAAIAVLQRAVNDAHPGRGWLKIDGKLGPRTLAALAACDLDILMSAFCAEQAAFYLTIIDEDPSQGCFKNGWLARARWPFPARRVV